MQTTNDSGHVAVPAELTDTSLELAGYLFENDGGKGYTSFNPINEWSGGRTDGIAVYKLRAQIDTSAHAATPQTDALMEKWEGDGASRGAAFLELRDLARELERRAGAA